MTTALVVTTIQGPNAVMQALATRARMAQAFFFVLGDKKSPPQYPLDGAEYFSIDAQHARFGAFSRLLPTGHYVRKNLGYLAALQAGCEWIVETDDDNYPLENFFVVPPPRLAVNHLRSDQTWVNVYRHFAPDSPVWPRGIPLEALATDRRSREQITAGEQVPVLVQGLANDNPDVDAVFRLTRELPVNFAAGTQPMALSEGLWCPFNSQNTWFRRDIAVLAYLPAHCSFRMTDIWRSFVAQRCLWAAGQRVIFVAPTVRQERNEHNLLRDFADEVPGYLNNARIAQILTACTLSGEYSADLRICYEALVKEKIFPPEELNLVQAWLSECAALI